MLFIEDESYLLSILSDFLFGIQGCHCPGLQSEKKHLAFWKMGPHKKWFASTAHMQMTNGGCVTFHKWLSCASYRYCRDVSKLKGEEVVSWLYLHFFELMLILTELLHCKSVQWCSVYCSSMRCRWWTCFLLLLLRSNIWPCTYLAVSSMAKSVESVVCIFIIFRMSISMTSTLFHTIIMSATRPMNLLSPHPSWEIEG